MRPENEPNLMQFYLRHCAFGFMLSAVFVALILWRDVAGIGSLVAGSDMGVLAVFLLWFFNGTIFGSVQFALVIMSQAEDDDDDDDDRGTLIPLRVTATNRSGRL
jgi:hypothetical protein